MKNVFPARQLFTGLVMILPALFFCPSAPANPTIRAAFFSIYTNAIGTALDLGSLVGSSKAEHCGVCHYNFSSGGDPWNPYGQAIRSFGVGGKTGPTNAIWNVRNLDPDGDGYTAQTEITDLSYGNTPTFPGLQASNLNLIVSANQSMVASYLTPSVIADTTPPSVTVTKPNGGEIYTADRWTNITWTASDASGIAAIHIYESLDNGATFSPVAFNLPNTGSYDWVPANRPVTNLARIKVVAVDGAANSTNDLSDTGFTITPPPFTNSHGVATTLRDFDMPGTQPFQGGPELASPEGCAQCHGNYNPAVEPYRNWQGSMMAQASIDPLFLANLSIANQDAADSGDLCLRCHFSRGWLQGRSVPTDGSRMQAADRIGVSCDLCHRMVDPVYVAGASPVVDSNILASLTFKGTNYGNGMYVIDYSSIQRGPFTNAAAPHSFTTSPFHRTSAFCGTCHDVSNPAFTVDAYGVYQPNPFNASSASFSPHAIGPVERTYSEWLASSYNSSNGVYAPAFAGGKTNGMVSTCQDCHMRDVAGYGCNTNLNAGVPYRTDVPLHDMTGGSIWLPGLLTNLYPADVNAAAIQAGIARAGYMLANAATLAVGDSNGFVKVTVTNECGHKLPTGYPEGRRIWLNVKFYNDANTLLDESCAYNPTNGVLTRDLQAKIYEVHPGIDTNISDLLGLAPEPSLHFVLNNKIYEDNRIPPRGFTNTAFAAFGGAPVGHHYDDGQYWDDTLYSLPAGATRAEVKLYYQSTSKEFIEFLRDENRTDTNGQAMYDLWDNYGKCPPTLMAEATWVTAFALKSTAMTLTNTFRVDFYSRPGLTYTVEFKNDLTEAAWHLFNAHGTFTATNSTSYIEDDFTANTSGSTPPAGCRFYRFRYTQP